MGAEDAEQTGALVFSGPQAQPKGAGSLSGPQVSSGLPRRSAGLPGSSGGSEATALASNSEAAQPTRLNGGVRPGKAFERLRTVVGKQFRLADHGLDSFIRMP